MRIRQGNSKDSVTENAQLAWRATTGDLDTTTSKETKTAGKTHVRRLECISSNAWGQMEREPRTMTEPVKGDELWKRQSVAGSFRLRLPGSWYCRSDFPRISSVVSHLDRIKICFAQNVALARRPEVQGTQETQHT